MALQRSTPATKRVPPPEALPHSPPMMDGNAPSVPLPREQLIAQLAYFRAAERGFAPGHELDDWLEAEAEIDRQLNSTGGSPRRAEEA